MVFALCRCEASDSVDIVSYFKGFATKQMLEANTKHTQN